MKKKLFSLVMAIILTVFIAFVFNGCKKDETKIEMRSYSFTVSRSNSALSNTSVVIPTKDQYYSATTDNDGKCQINIPNGVTLPTYLIVNIDHNSIKPYALSVSGSTNAKASSNINCQNVPSKVLVRYPVLNHLGDDIYNGSPNSQLQLVAKGSEKSFNFYLTNIPSKMPRLQIYTRGVQRTGQIQINGKITGGLNNSASNGDLSFWDFQLPQVIPLNQIFKIGNNVLTIKPGLSDGSDIWDDIEFCGLLLYY